MFLECSKIVLKYVLPVDYYLSLKCLRQSTSGLIRSLEIVLKWIFLLVLFFDIKIFITVCSKNYHHEMVDFFSCFVINIFQIVCTIITFYSDEEMENIMSLEKTTLTKTLKEKLVKTKTLITVLYIIDCTLVTLYISVWMSSNLRKGGDLMTAVISSCFWEYTEILKTTKVLKFCASLSIIGVIIDNTSENFKKKRCKNIEDFKLFVDQYNEYSMITNEVCLNNEKIVLCVANRDLFLSTFLVFRIIIRRHTFNTGMWGMMSFKRMTELFLHCFYIKRKMNGMKNIIISHFPTLPKATQKEINPFLLEMLHQKRIVNIKGFFDINGELIMAIVGTIFTYTLMLNQLEGIMHNKIN
ncbi:uncharacterized protein LOC123686503 [Harmonia axyridis]|uniref:uncharacterized protein LOC123686503 n=1 Tax=Harmonia axyridis TaxID=115357 RepID=UPI001E278E7F|nr:uncharacterized protein LOC123686503 [Harmonia axyridis]